MTTFESALTRAETDLANVQSALGAAQQVLEVADRAHSAGRRLVKVIRMVAIVAAIGGVLVAAVVLFDRLSRRRRREEGDATKEVNLPSPLAGPLDKRVASDTSPTDQVEDI
jgi:hypothetical protein